MVSRKIIEWVAGAIIVLMIVILFGLAVVGAINQWGQ